MADFKQTIDNVRIVAFDSNKSAEGKTFYKLGILQGREHCEMISCSEDLGRAFNSETMFDKPCRVSVKNMTTSKGTPWTVITDIDFIDSKSK